jgi:hypothetical protein
MAHTYPYYNLSAEQIRVEGYWVSGYEACFYPA